ncbi:MAG: cache domain-containing protein, partial [Anaerolineae bacterium]
MISKGTKQLAFIRSMRGKLLLAFLALALTPLVVVSILAYARARSALQDAAFAQLQAVLTIKEYQIEDYLAKKAADVGALLGVAHTLHDEAFDNLLAIHTIKQSQIVSYFAERRADVSTLASDKTVIEALTAFETAVHTGTIRGPVWKAVEQNVGPWLTQYKEAYGYYDLLLIAADGDIVYTVEGEPDLGENLLTGSLKDSPAAKAFQSARRPGRGLRAVTLQDFELYAPSGGIPAGFVAAPIQQDGRTIGVVALQLGLEHINAIMQDRTGMGQTGEVYLMGPDHRMRSDSSISPDHTVAASFAGMVGMAGLGSASVPAIPHPLTQEGREDCLICHGTGIGGAPQVSDEHVGRTDQSCRQCHIETRATSSGMDTVTSRQALAGESGASVTLGYRGQYVLSAYAPVKVEGLNWAIIAEMDVAEAFVPQAEGAEYDLFTQYAQNYGYPDLFLIAADGYVFHSAARRADYQTNMLVGPYKDSSLGQLVREVMSTGEPGIADFAPYAPSGGEPVAFLAARPVVYQGETELIVVVQL